MDHLNHIINDAADYAKSASAPVAVSALTANQIVTVLTGLYVSLQIFFLVSKHVGLYLERRRKAREAAGQVKNG